MPLCVQVQKNHWCVVSSCNDKKINWESKVGKARLLSWVCPTHSLFGEINNHREGSVCSELAIQSWGSELTSLTEPGRYWWPRLIGRWVPGIPLSPSLQVWVLGVRCFAQLDMKLRSSCCVTAISHTGPLPQPCNWSFVEKSCPGTPKTQSRNRKLVWRERILVLKLPPPRSPFSLMKIKCSSHNVIGCIKMEQS